MRPRVPTRAAGPPFCRGGRGGSGWKGQKPGYVAWDDPCSCQIIHLPGCICCASEVGQVGRDSPNRSIIALRTFRIVRRQKWSPCTQVHQFTVIYRPGQESVEPFQRQNPLKWGAPKFQWTNEEVELRRRAALNYQAKRDLGLGVMSILYNIACNSCTPPSPTFLHRASPSLVTRGGFHNNTPLPFLLPPPTARQAYLIP